MPGKAPVRHFTLTDLELNSALKGIKPLSCYSRSKSTAYCVNFQIFHENARFARSLELMLALLAV